MNEIEKLQQIVRIFYIITKRSTSIIISFLWVIAYYDLCSEDWLIVDVVIGQFDKRVQRNANNTNKPCGIRTV